MASFLNFKRTNADVPSNLLIDIAALPSATTFATNSFTGFTATAQMETRLTIGGVKGLSKKDPNDDSRLMLMSNLSWRDGSLVAYPGYAGSMGVRYNSLTGRGISLVHNANVSPGGSIYLSINTGMNFSNFVSGGGNPGLGTSFTLLSTNDLVGQFGSSGTVAVCNYTRTANDKFEIAVDADDIVLKINNVVAMTFPGKAIHCMDPGVCWVAPTQTYGATGQIAVNYRSLTPFASQMGQLDTNRVLYATDYGWKNTQTTGNMTAGSRTITNCNTTGFAVGDQIIIATTGEASGGQRGSAGVGGYHNDDGIHAATLAALLATDPGNLRKKGFITSGADAGRSIDSAINGDNVWYGPLVVTFMVSPLNRVAHEYANYRVGWKVTFADGATLPSPLVAGVDYYVKQMFSANSPDANFTISATPGGPEITLTGSPSGTQYMWPNLNWYMDFKAPKALVGVIGSIDSANQMTLTAGSKAAAVATTGAKIYHDNIPHVEILENAFEVVPREHNFRFVISGPEYAISRPISINGRTGLIIEGATNADTDSLIAPKGSICGFTFWSSCTRSGIKKLGQIGNHRLIGYGADWRIENGLGTPLPKMNYINICTDMIVEDMKMYEYWLDCANFDYCIQTDSSDRGPYGSKRNFATRQIEPQHYMGWCFVDGASSGITHEDNEIVLGNYGAGMETFQSTGSIFRRNKTTNATNSINSAGSVQIIDDTMHWTNDVLHLNTVFNPCYWNLNTNQDNLQGGLRLDGIVVGNPGRVSTNAMHGFSIGTVISFQFFGAIAQPIVAYKPYYVVEIVDPWNFRFSETPGGPPFNITSSGSGPQTVSLATTCTFSGQVVTLGSALSASVGGDLILGSVINFKTTGTLPAQLDIASCYFVTEVVSPTQVKIVRLPGEPTITFSGPGTGTHTIARAVSDRVAGGVIIDGFNWSCTPGGFHDTLTQASMMGISVLHPNVIIRNGYIKHNETSPGLSHGVCAIRTSSPGIIIENVRVDNVAPTAAGGFPGRIHLEGGTQKITNCRLPEGTAAITGDLSHATISGITNNVSTGMPAGADAIWFADQANTVAVRQHIPNEVTR